MKLKTNFLDILKASLIGIIVLLTLWCYFGQSGPRSDSREINPAIYKYIYLVEEECAKRPLSDSTKESCSELNEHLEKDPGIKNNVVSYSNLMRHSGFNMPVTYLVGSNDE